MTNFAFRNVAHIALRIYSQMLLALKSDIVNFVLHSCRVFCVIVNYFKLSLHTLSLHLALLTGPPPTVCVGDVPGVGAVRVVTTVSLLQHVVSLKDIKVKQ